MKLLLPRVRPIPCEPWEIPEPQPLESMYLDQAAEMARDLCLQSGIPFDKAVESLQTCPLPEKQSYPKWDTLKKNKKTLTDEEREEVMGRKAIWHHGLGGKPSPAVWKAEVDGKEWFVTATHRYWETRPTLAGAINSYHKRVEPTS